MFFIPPRRSTPTVPDAADLASDTEQSIHKRKRLFTKDKENTELTKSYYSKRVARACDRCRLKKTRCSGGKICRKCEQDNVVCVTTTLHKKIDRPFNPEYVHLVESQRDRLIQGVDKILQNTTSSDSTRLKALLADMGISTDNIRQSLPSDTTPAHSATADSSPLPWNEIFENLDLPQVEAVEAFCAAAIQTGGMSAVGTSPFQAYDNLHPDPASNDMRAPSSHLTSVGMFEQNESGPRVSLFDWDSTDFWTNEDMPLSGQDELTSKPVNMHDSAG